MSNKWMARLILSALLVVTLIPFASAKEGGIDGGGGGTLPAEHVSESAIREIVQKHAKTELRQLFRFMGEDGGKFFSGPKTLLDVLESTDIELKMKSPCYDAYGKEVDGSIHASKPGAICISAFRIAPKLIKERARIETEALIAHELTHLLGATEDEARNFQKQAAYLLSQAPNEEHVGVLTRFNLLRDAAERFSDPFYDMESDWKKTTYDQIADDINAVQKGLSDFWDKEFVTPFRLYTNEQEDYFRVQELRLQAIQWFVESQMSGPIAERARQDYEKAFGSKDRVTYEEFRRNWLGMSSESNCYKNEVVERIHNRSELRSQIRRLDDYFNEQRDFIYHLTFDSALIRLHGPWSQVKTNPWKAMLGHYRVTSSSGCDDSWKDTSFLVYEAQNQDRSYLELREIQSSSWEDVGGLFDGASDVNGASAVRVNGGQDWAERVTEFGDRWGENWIKRIQKLTRSTNGNYQMTIATTMRSWNWQDESPKDSTSTCTYNLTRIDN